MTQQHGLFSTAQLISKLAFSRSSVSRERANLTELILVIDFCAARRVGVAGGANSELFRRAAEGAGWRGEGRGVSLGRLRPLTAPNGNVSYSQQGRAETNPTEGSRQARKLNYAPTVTASWLNKYGKSSDGVEHGV